jgi:anthraniloyl-CoA monooxygenase
MRVAVVGGGPGGLYFSLLLKKELPHADVTIVERNPKGATYGWGVVFSDRTLTSFREADFKTYEQITDNFIIWDAIDVRYRDEIVRCGGQVFSGIARKKLLAILEERCLELGVRIEHERELDHLGDLAAGYDVIVGADGVRSIVRAAHENVFRPRITYGRSRYIWFGTERVLDSFTFAFRSTDEGFFQAHAYPFDGRMSTFIVECSEEAWRSAGLDQANEAESIATCERIFEPDLAGKALMSNQSKWINFVNLMNKRWHHENVVLIGDAAHTAHFSIGSGTKLAMEDSIALVNALVTKPDVGSALVDYQLERKPSVERFQDAARQSQTYFENTHRYTHMEPLQFAFHLLSRSGRMDYDDLRVRDRRFVASVDAHLAGRDGVRTVVVEPAALAPLRLGNLTLRNRVAVTARDEAVREVAAGGAGLVFTRPLAVSAHGRATLLERGLYTDVDEAAWSEEIAGVDSAVAATLNHSGPRGATHVRVDAADRPLLGEDAWTPLAASATRYARGSHVAAELDPQRMDEVVEAFAGAAIRATRAGFGLIEVHMGHGYLLASFISPLTNRREDEFGGTLENRLRFPLRVLDAVKAEAKDKPVGVAFSASDWARGGLRLDDAIAAARAFKEHGCDVIRVLAGQTVARFRPHYDPYYLTYLADRIRNDVGIATIATGDITTVDHANTIVAAGRADLCLLR